MLFKKELKHEHLTHKQELVRKIMLKKKEHLTKLETIQRRLARLLSIDAMHKTQGIAQNEELLHMIIATIEKKHQVFAKKSSRLQFP
jgi:hypothetical protein